VPTISLTWFDSASPSDIITKLPSNLA